MSKRQHSVDTDLSRNKRAALSLGIPSPKVQYPTKNALLTTHWPTEYAFRIANIPSRISVGQFLEIVDRLHVNLPSGGWLPDHGYQNLLGWSFAPSAASADAKKYRTATITFKSVPIELQDTGTPRIMNCIPNAPSAVIDKSSYGLTTLYSGDQPIID